MLNHTYNVPLAIQLQKNPVPIHTNYTGYQVTL